MTPPMRRAALTVLLGCAAVLLMACAQGVETIRVDRMGGYSGITFCLPGKAAVSMLNLDVWGTADMVTTPAHEAKHREQFTRWPSCQAFHRYFRTTTGYLSTEGEAYAAGYCAGRNFGLDSVDLFDDMRARFRGITHGMVAEAVADSVFTHYAGAC